MLIPLSNLREKVVRDVVLAVEQGRAELAGKYFIATESPKINFTIDLVIDTLDYIDGDITESTTPDTTTVTQKGEDASTQTQEAVTTSEFQTTTPGVDSTNQAFGRTTTTTTEETT